MTLSKSPERLYSFFETPIFMRQIEQLASMKVLFAIEDDLLKNPERGDVIQGTHGARKARIGIRRPEKASEGVTGTYTCSIQAIITLSCCTCLRRTTRPTYRPK